MDTRLTEERGILFTGQMVGAVLGGKKTQTRRVAGGLAALNGGYYAGRVGKTSFADGKWWFYELGCGSSALPVAGFPCPYGQPGSRLWVKETFSIWDHSFNEVEVVYAADPDAAGKVVEFENGEKPSGIYRRKRDGRKPWRPSIFMPRWASRVTLELTDVRVERVQAISEEDAVAEGCVRVSQAEGDYYQGSAHPTKGAPKVFPCARAAYHDLWDSINARRGFGWAANPFVWVLSFRRIAAEQNFCASHGAG